MAEMPSFTVNTTIDIAASRDAVWRVLPDFRSYDEWNPSFRIEGTPVVGTKIVVHLKKDGFTFKPKVLAATPGEEFRWLGRLGSRRIVAGEHFFVLTTNDDGTTRLHHGERFSGLLVALARGGSRNGAAGYEAFSQALKQRVEGVRHASGDPSAGSKRL
jgi:hypothetical protein